MDTANNPFLKEPEYFSEYNKNIENLKNKPEYIQFDKLCYELFFANETGVKFMEVIEETYLIPALVSINAPNYETACVWAEGFKEAFRTLRRAVIQHKQRIKSEEKSKA